MLLNVIGYLITYYKNNKLNCQIIMLYSHKNELNGMILILKLLMTVIQFNRP
jgi:hypothetical protein